ncbi:MAG TPA: FadD3 family acyl-CoA ligase [Acidimicrobiia bacterium]|nr:FadD3 family acyl-CoA ligase [Acidimicrobiia bacterium]
MEPAADPTRSGDVTIPALVRRAARTWPAAEALVDDEGSVRVSFAGLEERMVTSTRAAIAAGLEPGDRAAIWAPNLHEWMVAALGVLGAGGVLVPINTRFKGAEAAYVLGKSGARVLFTVTGFLDTDYVALLRAADADLPALDRTVVLRGDDPEGTVSFDAYLAAGGEVDAATAAGRIDAVAPDDLSDLIFTSGTTGQPKGVMTTHGQSVRVYEAWTDVIGLRAGDRYLIVNPFFHTFGYKAGWMSCVLRGATIVPCSIFDVPKVLEMVAAEHISVLPGPPTLLQSILDFPERDAFDLSSLRLTVTGAAAVPVRLIERLRDEMTFETIITGYGLTESTGTTAMCRHDDDPETIARWSGKAIPDTELRVVDDDGAEVPVGEPGEVVTRGYHVMQGYYDEPSETSATIDADGWLHTGDIGVMDERGYVRITDRKKDMFIVGGFNAYPAEIENLLLGNDALAQVAVIGVPDERLGEVAAAYVVPRPGATVSAEAVVAWAREHLANYKVPRRVEVVDELPMNASGKVLKYVLRERAARDAHD